MKKIRLLLFGLLMASAAFTQNNRLHVNLAATGAATGLSWADAYPDLQMALSAAVAGDTVWMAEGIYYPTTSNNRAVSFEPKSGVRIFGGFAGSESELSHRDWSAHPVVLSGDIGTQGDSTDNSYNVLYLFQPDSNTVLDGLILRDGVANNSAGASNTRSRLVCGGGLYIMAVGAEAYPEIRNCRFEHNTAQYYGGGAMVNGSNDGSTGPRWNNCVFEDNSALNNGGGLAKFGASFVERGVDLIECRFTRNRSGSRGGGLYYIDSDGNDLIGIHNCRFEENMAFTAGGAAVFFLGRAGKSALDIHQSDFCGNISSNGAALGFFGNGSDFDGTIEIDSCIFKNNKSEDLNPNNLFFNIIYCDLLTASQSKFILQDDVFEQNSVLFGSGFKRIIEIGFYNSSIAIIENSVFKNNETERVIVLSDFKENSITNTVFSGNKQNSTSTHGNVHKTQYINCSFTNDIATGPLYFEFASGINFMDTCIFENCTIYNDSIYPKMIGSTGLKKLYIRNTFLKEVPTAYFYKPNCKTELSNCYLPGFDCAAQNPNVTCEGGIITDGDPMFIDTVQGDFRLQPCSPLVGAGNNTWVTGSTDLAGQARIQGGTVDIGAYETMAPALAADPVVGSACPGVANGAVSLPATNGCAPYQLTWSSGANSGQGGDHLEAGSYIFTVTDARGSSFTTTLSVPEGSMLTLEPQSLPVICGDTLGGSAAVQVEGGPAPFAFQWPASTDSALVHLPAGEYPVTVTDALGCMASGSVTVETSGSLSMTVEASGISCFGAADGSLTVLPTDGKPPYHWQWENGPASPAFGPLGPGTYMGTLTDGLGCDVIWVLALSEPDSLSFEAVVSPSSDSIADNGSIQLDPIAGGTQPYIALWSNGQTGPAIHGLSQGTYSVTLTDYNGCSKTATYMVPLTVGLAETGNAPILQIFPNPASQMIQLRLEALAISGEICVYNAVGQMVFRQLYPDLNAAINVQAWPAGLYHLVARKASGQHFAGSFIKQN